MNIALSLFVTILMLSSPCFSYRVQIRNITTETFKVQADSLSLNVLPRAIENLDYGITIEATSGPYAGIKGKYVGAAEPDLRCFILQGKPVITADDNELYPLDNMIYGNEDQMKAQQIARTQAANQTKPITEAAAIVSTAPPAPPPAPKPTPPPFREPQQKPTPQPEPQPVIEKPAEKPAEKAKPTTPATTAKPTTVPPTTTTPTSTRLPGQPPLGTPPTTVPGAVPGMVPATQTTPGTGTTPGSVGTTTPPASTGTGTTQVGSVSATVAPAAAYIGTSATAAGVVPRPALPEMQHHLQRIP